MKKDKPDIQDNKQSVSDDKTTFNDSPISSGKSMLHFFFPNSWLFLFLGI